MLTASLSVSTAVVQVDGSPVRLQLCDTAGQVSLPTPNRHAFTLGWDYSRHNRSGRLASGPLQSI